MIRTHDIFKAAYLKAVSRADYPDWFVKIEKNENGGTVFMISGEEIGQWDMVYKNGWAVVGVVDFKEAFCDLLIGSGQSIGSKTHKP